jgi:MFS family permease
MDRYPTGIIFWVAIVFIVMIAALRRYLTERERQQTIRAALERGQQIDPALLQNIVARPKPANSFEGLQTGGIIMIALGIGLAVMGYCISLGDPSDHNARMPMLGVGLMVACMGTGMLIASRLVRRPKDGSAPPGSGM